jgi:galactoside O-acetyltransferase
MYSFPITIGDNVWLGGNVMVLPGVTIGENSVIGAGSVVTKDIPANVVAFGSPCKVYREINERDEEYYFGNRRFDELPGK